MTELRPNPLPYTLTITLVDSHNWKSTLSFDLTTTDINQALVDAQDIVAKVKPITTAKIQKYSLDVSYWNQTAEKPPENSSVAKVASIQTEIQSYAGRGGKYKQHSLSIPSPAKEIFQGPRSTQINIASPLLKDFIAIFQGKQPKAIVRSRKYKINKIVSGHFKTRKRSGKK